MGTGGVQCLVSPCPTNLINNGLSCYNSPLYSTLSSAVQLKDKNKQPVTIRLSRTEGTQ